MTRLTAVQEAAVPGFQGHAFGWTSKPDRVRHQSGHHEGAKLSALGKPAASLASPSVFCMTLRRPRTACAAPLAPDWASDAASCTASMASKSAWPALADAASLSPARPRDGHMNRLQGASQVIARRRRGAASSAHRGMIACAAIRVLTYNSRVCRVRSKGYDACLCKARDQLCRV